jgi:transcriptional regulator with XRE-family HTH domain
MTWAVISSKRAKTRRSFMTPSELVGRRIKQAREALKMSQKRLGEDLAEYLGIEWAPQAVSAAEKGRRRFEAAELLALGIVLKQPATWFLTPTPRDEIEMPSGRVLSGRDLISGPAAGDPAKQAFDISERAESSFRAVEAALRELEPLRTAGPTLVETLRALTRAIGETGESGPDSGGEG